ncbi:tyrosine-type recombinase/integrase [Luteibaculum oceani]|uniref:Tyrosine-type recombinase/integrase n=1 Tax=Luteibaculum oceani TaxID=1294296 RepID=A0A5C6V926_9FLAO|nr:tyrosine-type recombinase/integrase [Luteibaculum oceani]TXC81629.1 tyrosine-type recombinase/integrase [Luteibaculum oceani]
MINQFLDYLEHQRRYSAHTVAAYKKDLEQFSLYLEETYEISEITKADRQLIRSWVLALMESGVAPSSVSRKLASLSTYFKFMQRQGAVNANPVGLVSKPKKAKKLPVYLDVSSIEKLFHAELFDRDYYGQQDRVILEMFFGTGIRLSELIEIKRINLDIGKGLVKVLGKRNKERVIPLTMNLVNLLRDFLVLRDGNVSSEIPFLFVTKTGKKLYPKFVYRLVNNYLNQVTTITKKSPHVLRHTFATHMLNQGADLNAIKEILGHASLAATQVYTHNSIEKNKSIFKKAHPRG